MQTGIGPLAVIGARMHDRGVDADRKRIHFASSVLPL
jgi:hypothetical protein